tara:strand:- start:86 stop:448 length:363 start_codon:yes stop_codon:yes gene_type:complete
MARIQLTVEEKKARKKIINENYRKSINGKARLKAAKQKWVLTPNGKKLEKINSWKYRKIKDQDFSSLYDLYLNETHCWICGKEFIPNTMQHSKCLDHDHETGEPRFICCGYCNLKVLNKI